MTKMIYRMGAILALRPTDTNSTMFTSCCEMAIRDHQSYCPSCGKKVIGADELTNENRHRIRWTYATKHWHRRRNSTPTLNLSR